MRIAGIEHDVSTLELMWAQSDDHEKTILAMSLMTKMYDTVGQDLELTVDTDDGVYVVSISKRVAQAETEGTL